MRRLLQSLGGQLGEEAGEGEGLGGVRRGGGEVGGLERDVGGRISYVC